jgi:hypothetical protein
MASREEHTMRTTSRLRTIALVTLASGSLTGVLLARSTAASASARCRPVPTATAYVRAELVDRWGQSSGSFVDSRCPGRTLTAHLSSRYHYIRHSGVVEPGSTMTFTYTNASTGQAVHADATTARRSGFFRTSVVDLRAFMSRGDALAVSAHHESPGPGILQDLIEYALLAAFVAIAP